MTWVPERPGRRLFHCHMLIHMSPPVSRLASEGPEVGDGIASLSRPERASRPAAAHEHPLDKEAERAGMAGLVLGITVESRKERSEPAPWHPERKLQLTIDERKNGARPLYALGVRDLAQPPSPSLGPPTPDLIGPPMVLTRGQPTEIEIVNRSKRPTTIHSHGIEL